MAPRKRKHVPLKTKLAAALLALGHIPYEESKAMTADQIIRRYDFDHWPILHALGGPDLPWNLRPLLRAPHKEKSKRDTAIVAKVKRIQRKLLKVGVPAIVELPRCRHCGGAGVGCCQGAIKIGRAKKNAPATLKSPWRGKRRIPSRPFPKAHRPMRNRPWPSPSP